MKIVLVSVVRNELDILEAFVRYHAEIVDHIVIAEHRSIDGSSELLETLEREGLPVSVRTLTAAAFNQAQTITELMREACASFEPDFVVPLDADEFLGTDDERPVRELVAQLSTSVPTSVPMRHYVATPDDDQADANPITRIVHRRTLDGKTKWKVIVPHLIAADPVYGLSNGNHRVIIQGQRTKVPPQPSADLFIAHYPARSVDQVSAKVVGWFAGRIVRTDRPAKLNATKRRIIAQLARSGSPPPEWLMDVGLSYMMDSEPEEPPRIERDPLNPAPSIRYPNQTSVSAIGILADALEEIAEIVRQSQKPARKAGRVSGGGAPEMEGSGQKLERAEERVRELENELDSGRSSVSWKVSAPFRGLRRRSG